MVEVAASLATTLGIPIAIFIFLWDRRKDRLAREAETYNLSNQKYIDYLGLCLQHPDEDVFDLSMSDPSMIACGSSYKKMILFTILIAITESAFLQYRRHRASPTKDTQWKGWHDYMVMCAKRDEFRKAWLVLGPQFDTDFVNFMADIFHQLAVGKEQTPAASECDLKPAQS